MMTKKNYERAAALVQALYVAAEVSKVRDSEELAEEKKRAADTAKRTFVMFFSDDNPKFDEVRFHGACEPKDKQSKKR